jgi:hypothetical protein
MCFGGGEDAAVTLFAAQGTKGRMTALVPPPPLADPPDHAPGRRRWRITEIERMLAAGVLAEDEPYDLIEGELVTPAPKNRRHEIVRDQLNDCWARRLPTPSDARRSPEDVVSVVVVISMLRAQKTKPG